MTERLADIVRQISNVGQLQSVVSAMRGIAASRAMKARALLEGIEAYNDIISRSIGEALALVPPDPLVMRRCKGACPALILFCAEQGFAGAFSERVLEAAHDMEGAKCIVLGKRGLLVAGERGLKPAWSTPMASQVDGISEVINLLADKLYSFVSAGMLTKVDVVFSRSEPNGNVAVDRHSLLPLDFARFPIALNATPPLITLAPERLLEQLAGEYVFTQLYKAAAHTLEAENSARMMAMASAKTNIETKLAVLSQRETQLRQDEITTEIVELAAGAEALGDSANFM